MGGAGVSGSEEGSSEVAEVRVMTGVVLVVFFYSFIKDENKRGDGVRGEG
jgi:hypothetical protein